MIGIHFEGGVELAKALASLSPRVSKRVQREALMDAGEPMAAAMASKAPRGPDAPHLKQMIVVSPAQGQDAQETAVAVGPSKRGFYGSFNELGTAHQAARPFARPGFDETVMKSLGIVGEALWLALAGRSIHRSATVDAPVEDLGMDWASEGTKARR